MNTSIFGENLQEKLQKQLQIAKKFTYKNKVVGILYETLCQCIHLVKF